MNKSQIYDYLKLIEFCIPVNRGRVCPCCGAFKQEFRKRRGEVKHKAGCPVGKALQDVVCSLALDEMQGLERRLEPDTVKAIKAANEKLASVLDTNDGRLTVCPVCESASVTLHDDTCLTGAVHRLP